MGCYDYKCKAYHQWVIEKPFDFWLVLWCEEKPLKLSVDIIVAKVNVTNSYAIVCHFSEFNNKVEVLVLSQGIDIDEGYHSILW
jgi:hypothetical protein